MPTGIVHTSESKVPWPSCRMPVLHLGVHIPDQHSASDLFNVANSAGHPLTVIHRMASSSLKVWCKRMSKPSVAKFAQHEIAEHPHRAIIQAKSRLMVTFFS